MNTTAPSHDSGMNRLRTSSVLHLRQSSMPLSVYNMELCPLDPRPTTKLRPTAGQCTMAISQLTGGSTSETVLCDPRNLYEAVASMALVYRTSYSVIVWLGDGTSAEDDAAAFGDIRPMTQSFTDILQQRLPIRLA